MLMWQNRITIVSCVFSSTTCIALCLIIVMVLLLVAEANNLAKLHFEIPSTRAPGTGIPTRLVDARRDQEATTSQSRGQTKRWWCSLM